MRLGQVGEDGRSSSSSRIEESDAVAVLCEVPVLALFVAVVLPLLPALLTQDEWRCRLPSRTGASKNRSSVRDLLVTFGSSSSPHPQLKGSQRHAQLRARGRFDAESAAIKETSRAYGSKGYTNTEGCVLV
eukprot:TRINITY_DN480_c0_g1_i2.p2 TRINITY_DN480_c0_g1~~TRINITY_DN480_c0_g1_i2.p2  ORF type:complete len:131 (-),score=9.91 TRINITY_DN480_c0_g1_i2:257-649(-)